jgi:glycosyltransferase involved in cell wall biosynthesis/O-antigen/teichoic acid export membrane protein
MRKFFETSIAGAVVSLSRLIFGFARSKYTALSLGVAGVGLIAQSNQLFLLGITLCSFAMASGITYRYSFLSASGDQDSLRRLTSTAFTVQVLASLIILLFGAIFRNTLAFSAFGIRAETLPFIFTLAGIPLTTLANSYIQSLFMGHQRYDLFMRATLWSGLLSVVVFFLCVHRYGLSGAFFSLFLNTAIVFIFFCFYIRKIIPLGEIFNFGFDFSEFKILIRYGAVSLVSGACLFGSNLIIRRQVLAQWGVEMNGLIQVPLALTAYYTPFLTDVLWNRLFPQISKTGEGTSSAEELALALRFVTLSQTAIVLILLCTRNLMIKFAYSAAFLASSRLIPAFLAADYFYFLIFVLTTYLLGLSRLRAYLAVWLGFYIVQTGVSLCTLPHLGAWAIPLGYGVASFIFAVACAIKLVGSSPEPALLAAVPGILGCAMIVMGQSALDFFHSPRYVKFILPSVFALYCLRVGRKFLQSRLMDSPPPSSQVLFVIDSLGRGGAEQALLNLVPYLSARGYVCAVAVLRGPYDLAQDFEALGVRVHRLDLFHRWSLIEGVLKIDRLVRRHQYGIVHAHLFFSAIHVAFCRSLRVRVRRFVSFHSLEFSRDPTTTVFKKFRRAFQLSILRNGFDGWTAVSKSVAEHYGEYVCKSVEIIPNALSPALFTIEPVPRAKAAVFGKYASIQGSDLIVVMPGRLIPEKGHQHLIQAVRRLADEGVRTQVFCFGMGPLLKPLKDEVSILGLGGSFHFCGVLPQAELLECMRIADIVVQPSESEGFGLAVAEAMALGKPLITTRSGGLSELVEDGVSGLLTPPGDSVALAEAIERLSQNTKLREEMGQAARSRITQILNGGSIAERVEKFYESIY